MSREQSKDNSPRDRPKRLFYSIDPRPDGTVDVYLMPSIWFYPTDVGVTEFDVDLRVVRGVESYPELEEDIRRRYTAWCETAEVIEV